MEEQIERAIEVGWDPRSDQSLKAQAFDYLNQLRSQREGWSLCFSLALRDHPPSEVVRHVSLDIFNNAVKKQQLSNEDLMAVSSNLLAYIERIYGSRAAKGVTRDPVTIQNKITQTMTHLFVAMYETRWPTFFHDILKLTSSNGSAARDNGPGTVMYLRILIAIHDEIADVMMSKTPEEQKGDIVLKDLVRERDIRLISTSWHEILSTWSGKEDAIVELCLTCIGRWVSWTDISLAVNESLLALLFSMLSPHLSGDQGVKTQENREAAIETFVDILGKKMNPADKIELIDAIKVDGAISSLINGRSLAQQRHTPEYDTDLAEDVAKLVNNTLADVVRAVDSAKMDDTVAVRGTQQMKSFLPHALRFLSDEYDEICSTVIPCLTDLLALMRKQSKLRSNFLSETSFMLPQILDAVIAKVKYDETAEWASEDTQTDEAEFQELRKRLHVLQQAVAAVDEAMYTQKITSLVVGTFATFKAQNGQSDWRNIELCLHQMYLFGELAMKNGGLYSKTKPVTPAAEQLIRMLFELMNTDVPTSSHPAIHLQFMELCVRYYMFFEANPSYISRVLEYFVTFIHHEHPKVKLRSWYLFQRFVKHVRSHLGNIAETVLRALADLLPIKAEVPPESSEKDDEDGSSSTDGQSANARFTSQLYLYEIAGCIASVRAVPVNEQVVLIRSILDPLFSDMETHIDAARSGIKQACLQIHHLIMALGTVARGFSDWVPGQATSHSSAPADAVSQEFSRASEAILLSLERLKMTFEIREAGRFAFSRLIGVLGNRILIQLARWIDGLLTADSTKDEIALFMRLLDQVVYGFKTEIYDILNSLLSPLLERVFRGIGEATTGTDDEIQLAELKREYLAFLSVILNNSLESVLVSEANQTTFGLIISTMEHLARDVNDFPTAKLAFSVLTRMVATWGGPDVVPVPKNPRAPSVSEMESKAKLEGFDHFMITRFSPLSWAIPSNPSFDPKDAQGKQVLSEAAGLQKAIYNKTGEEYLVYLRNVELGGMGMDAATVETYLAAITTMDLKAFQQFFKNLVQRNGT